MSNFQQALGTHFASSATTICNCWIVTRNDGERLGFCDHDQDIVVDGVACRAISGFRPTQAAQQLGLSVDDQQIEGVLDGEVLTEADLLSGLYDNAQVAVWMVNWQNPVERFQSRLAFLGEVSQKDSLFEAELRGLTSVLEKNVGRTYSRQCDAILGDAKCGVDTLAQALRCEGSVSAVQSRKRFQSHELELFDPNWFVSGNLTWITGQNAGQNVDLASTAVTQKQDVILWESMPNEIETGDTFSLIAGCDKSFSTCQEKFNNHLNFRGCPHIPGQDFVLGYATSSGANDGSSLAQ